MQANNQRYWDEQAAHYDSIYSSQWWNLEDRRIKDWLPRLALPDSPVVLDIGCGNGFLFRQLEAAEIKCDYIGIDISSEMIHRFHPACKERVQLEVADFANYEWNRREAPDLIASIYCPLSFSEGRWPALRRLAAKQKPGGKLFLMVLNRFSLRRLLRYQLGSRGYYSPRGRPKGQASERDSNVQVFYDRPSQVRAAVTWAGYKVVHLDGDGPLSGVLEIPALWGANDWVGRMSPALSYSMILVAEKQP